MSVPANAVTVSGFGDSLVAATASARVLLLLADRNALPAHPALIYAKDATNSGSNVVSVKHAGLYGYDILAASTEGDDTANTAYTDGKSDITVVTRDKLYEATDLVRAVDGIGVLNADVLARDALISASADMVELVANIADDFSAQVNRTTLDATAADMLEMIATLEIAKVQGPYLFMPHPRQWADIRADLALTSGGAVQWNQGSQMVLDAMKGLGAQGNLFGVDVHTTARVPTHNAGADYASGMWGCCGVVWADAAPPVDDPVNQMLIGAGGGVRVLFEKIRSGKANRTAFGTKRLVGVSIGINACGVTLISDL